MSTAPDIDLKIVEIKAYPTSFPVKPEDSVSLGVGRAVSSEAREPMFPQVPTIAETPGLTGYSAGSWQGILGPAKLSPDIVNKLYTEVRRIVATPEFSEKLTSQGSRPQTKTPQEMGKWLATEKDHWAKVVKESGLKIE